jgi:hypothetical protein
MSRKPGSASCLPLNELKSGVANSNGVKQAAPWLSHRGADGGRHGGSATAQVFRRQAGSSDSTCHAGRASQLEMAVEPIRSPRAGVTASISPPVTPTDDDLIRWRRCGCNIF